MFHFFVRFAGTCFFDTPPVDEQCKETSRRMIWRRKTSSAVDAGKIAVSIYSKPDCHLCETAKAQLVALQRRYGFQLTEVDISRDENLLAEFGTRIPLIWANGKLVGKYQVDEAALLAELRRASAPGTVEG